MMVHYQIAASNVESVEYQIPLSILIQSNFGQYDVFLNHLGLDFKMTFVSHLNNALR